MGLLNFFRKKKEEEEPVKKVSISEADLLLKTKAEKEKEDIREVKEKTKKRVAKFILELKEKIDVLNLINLEKRREDERIKSMTSQGLREYIEELEKFIENLREIDTGTEFYHYIKKIDRAHEIFVWNSRKKLEKATILIGKELAQTEEIIKIFHKEIDMILRQNSRRISRMGGMDKLGELRALIHKIKKIQDEKNNFIRSLEKEKKEIIMKRNKEKKEFDLFRGSEECKCWIEKKENLKKEKQKFDNYVKKLKEKMNFKLLLNKFHGIPRSLELLKDYRDDFLSALMSDSRFKILDMIEGNEKKSIEKELKEIYIKNQQLKEKENYYKIHKKEDSLLSDIKKADYQADVIDKKIKEEDKKLKRFVEKEKELQEEEVKIIESILKNTKIINKDL